MSDICLTAFHSHRCTTFQTPAPVSTPAPAFRSADVSALRKEGRLADARTASTQLLSRQPHDLYNRRAAAWVYLDSIKKDSLNLEEALPYLESLLAVGLDATERILWEQLYWQVAKLLFRLPKAPDPTLFSSLQGGWGAWPRVAGPAYSTLLKALLKHATHLPDLPAWVEAWGWENLGDLDFEPETLPDGRTLTALAERAYLAVAKAYLTLPVPDPALVGFVDRLDAVSDAHPGLLYLVYYRALLWHKRGQASHALEVFLPFARKKQRDFWVWDLLGQLHYDSPSLHMACLAKALSCRTKPEFLVKIRQKMASLLIDAGRWAHARAEIEALCAVRQAHQWRIPAEVTRWMAHASYREAESNTTNDKDYTLLMPKAEKLLQREQPPVATVVWAVNTQKQTAQFVVNEQVQGGFGYARFGLTLAAGDCLWLGLEKVTPKGGETYWKVNEATLSTAPAPADLLRTVEGPLKSSGAIGFVQDVLVEPNLMKGLSHGDICQITAVKAYNSKKQCWGWKAIQIMK